MLPVSDVPKVVHILTPLATSGATPGEEELAGYKSALPQEPKTAGYNPDMPNHRVNGHQSNAQPSSSVHADGVGYLKQEMARLTAYIGKLMVQQYAPDRN
uniref:Uncharacterized protein n=1 Tax=Romanomermis culicivorax TaxID=13658 RepID=A0A915IU15_ROMCU